MIRGQHIGKRGFPLRCGGAPIFCVVWLSLAALRSVCAAPALVTGDAAAAWFPQQVRDAEVLLASRFDLAPGVEYGYVFCAKLFGHPGDLHAVRIDLAKAALRPWIHEGSEQDAASERIQTTSAAAAKAKALFAVNGGFFTWTDLIPYYRMKVNGKIYKSTAGGDVGLAFSNDGKRVFVGRVPAAELEKWDNFIAGEGLLNNGRCMLEWKRADGPKKAPEAPRTFVGMDAERRYLWLFVSGGRLTGRRKSMGLSYFDASDVLAWFGCANGVNLDGGGSTTLAMRADAMPAKPESCTPECHRAKVQGYWILNCTSDGRERRVLDHLLFLDAASAK